MRVAAVYDIHGNLPALEAVLHDVRRAGVDLIVVGGDVIPGPMPRECLARLLSLDLPTHFIQGNGESNVLGALEGADLDHIPAQFHEVMRWTGEQLDLQQRNEIASWPSTFELEDGDVIQSIDGREPRDVRHAMRILNSYQSGEKLKLGIMRDKKKRTLDVEIPTDKHGSLFDGPEQEMRPAAAPLPMRAPVPPVETTRT